MDFFKENRFLIQEIDGRKKYAIDKTVQINHMPFATNTTYRMMSAIPIGLEKIRYQTQPSLWGSWELEKADTLGLAIQIHSQNSHRLNFQP
jgi:hypothetical protein